MPLAIGTYVHLLAYNGDAVRLIALGVQDLQTGKMSASACSLRLRLAYLNMTLRSLAPFSGKSKSWTEVL
jgi:hypothetical protein